MNSASNESILLEEENAPGVAETAHNDYLSDSYEFKHIEALLKEHEGRRRNASKTIYETNKYIQFGGNKDSKSELIESLCLSSPKLSADRVQSQSDPDTKIINLVERIDDQLFVFNDSIKRRREKAIKTIQELDDLIECVEELPEKLQTIIQTLYYSYEIEMIDGMEVEKPMRYLTAIAVCGYSSESWFRNQRKKAIAMLVKMMRQKRRERR